MTRVIFALAALVACVNAAPFITNGEDAAPKEFPYQISLQWGILGIFQHVCGGSIIADQWILTAGHCLTELPFKGDMKIKAGLTKLNENGDHVQHIDVVERIVHPNYQGGVNPYDIALLRLAAPLKMTDGVKPIGLPEAGAVPTGKSILSGWGSTSTTILPSMPNSLQKVELPLLTYNECDNALSSLIGSSDPLSADSNVCTGPLTGGLSACSGDSGGPLAQDGKVIGVVSWGIMPCGSVGAPSVYSQVSSFIDFINEHIK